MEELKQAFYEVMYKYQKCFGADGVYINLSTWREKKARLRELLSRHPNWVEAEKAVILRYAEGRGIQQDVVDEIGFSLMDLAVQTVPQEEFPAFRDALGAIIREYSTTLPEPALEIVRNRGGIKCATGQKASRIIGKLCRKFGVDAHERYNAVFAQIADALNPLQIERTAVLSIHPCDFLEMSNRDNTWTSCHNLDGGGYQMGALSYMVDEVSMIFYTVDSNVTDHFYRAPRRSRQMYFFEENALFQSRMYPADAKDLMDQYRGVVQKVIATCLGVPNLWTLKKERNEISGHITTVRGSMQYPDYDYTGNFSVLKGTELLTVIHVGAPPICVSCGRNINQRNRGLKCDCAETVVCADCAETVLVDNALYEGGVYHCKRCMHICAVCGRASVGEMFPAFDRRGQLLQVCSACHAVSQTPCGRCSVRRVCDIIGRRLCPRAAVTERRGGAA